MLPRRLRVVDREVGARAADRDARLLDAKDASRVRSVDDGQFDAARPGNGIPVTGSDLRAAVQSLLSGKPPTSDQKPSIGCSIKWKK